MFQTIAYLSLSLSKTIQGLLWSRPISFQLKLFSYGVYFFLLLLKELLSFLISFHLIVIDIRLYTLNITFTIIYVCVFINDGPRLFVCVCMCVRMCVHARIQTRILYYDEGVGGMNNVLLVKHVNLVIYRIDHT